jgi:hypothetical protein
MPAPTPAQIAAELDAGCIFAHSSQPAALALALLAHPIDRAAMARIRRLIGEGESLAEAIPEALLDLAKRAVVLHDMLVDEESDR